MRQRWLASLIPPLLMASLAHAQPADPMAAVEAMMGQGNYGQALTELLEIRDDGGGVRIDTLIATCACHVPEQHDLGLELFRWILDKSAYAIDRDERSRIEVAAKSCGYAPIHSVYLVSTSGFGQAGMEGSGKLYHMIPHPSGEGPPKASDLSIATDPIKVTAPRPPEELSSRVFPPDQVGAAVVKIKQVAGTGFNVIATRDFVLASAGSHSEQELRTIGSELEKMERFLGLRLGLPPRDSLVTVYLVPSVAELRAFATRVHGASTGKFCIGYSFPADVSIVAVIPGERIGTLKHELVHTLVSARFPDLPPWLDEGLAALYEESKTEGEDLIGVWGWRQQLLREFWSMRPTIPALLRMSRAEFNRIGGDVEHQAVIHATARTLLLYVQDRSRLPEVFDAFRPRNPLEPPDPIPSDPVERLAKALGTNASSIDQEFAAWFKAHT